MCDIGFGDGRMLVAACLHGFHAIGIENSRRLVDRAQSVARRCGLATMGLEAGVPALAQAPLGDVLCSADTAAHLAVTAVQSIVAQEKAAAASPPAEAISAAAADHIVAFDTPDPPVNARHPLLILDELDIGNPRLITDVLPAVNIVFLYLLPEVNKFLWARLLMYLPLGGRVIAYTFTLLPAPASPGPRDFLWPIEHECEGKAEHDKLRVYRVTAELRERYREWASVNPDLDSLQLSLPT